VVLGSFVLDQPARTPYHEILVGDPNHRINRISFPARFRESNDPLVQVEFAHPLAEDPGFDEEAWRASWLASLIELGILEPDRRVEAFDFRSFALHFNGYGMEGEALVDADPGVLNPASNIAPVAPSMANLNLNAHVPMAIETVTRRLCGNEARS
jgi:hypothetical protein